LAISWLERLEPASCCCGAVMIPSPIDRSLTGSSMPHQEGSVQPVGHESPDLNQNVGQHAKEDSCHG
jgi:hypothetical protein